MTGTKDLKTLALFGLLAAIVFTAAGAIGNWMDARNTPAEPEAESRPPGWMVDDLLAEAREITREAAPDGPGPR